MSLVLFLLIKFENLTDHPTWANCAVQKVFGAIFNNFLSII